MKPLSFSIPVFIRTPTGASPSEDVCNDGGVCSRRSSSRCSRHGVRSHTSSTRSALSGWVKPQSACEHHWLVYCGFTCSTLIHVLRPCTRRTRRAVGMPMREDASHQPFGRGCRGVGRLAKPSGSITLKTQRRSAPVAFMFCYWVCY